MKAARWYGRNDMRVEDVEEPVPQDGEVKIKVEWCGICGSDLHEYAAGPFFIPVTEPHLLTGALAPVTLGHEFSGRVADIGRNVLGWEIGEKVTADPKYYCGECFWCKRGRYNQCEKLAFIGQASENGAFAEYICVPVELVYRLSTNMTLEEGALVEPTAIGVHSVRRSEIKEGDTAVVVGAGPIGNLTMQALISAGVRRVFVVEILKSRIHVAKRLGADEVFNPKEVDVNDKIKKLTNGIGADFAFECVGSEATIQLCINLTRTGGSVVVVGLFEKPSLIDLNKIVFSERKLIGSTDGDFDASIALISRGKIDVKSLITSKIKLDDIVEKGFKELLNRKEKHMKILVSPR